MANAAPYLRRDGEFREAEMLDGEKQDANPVAIGTPLRRSVWMLAIVFALGILSVSIMLWTDKINDRQRDSFILENAIMDAQIRASTFHLWFEEALSGDIQLGFEQVWGDFDRAVELVASILSGGQSEHGLIVRPLQDPAHRTQAEEMRSLLAQFKAIGKKRQEAPETAGIGSALDEEFDTVFGEFLGKARALELAIETSLRVDQISSRRLLWIIQFVWITVVFAAMLGLWYLERQRRSGEKALQSANKQLASQADELMLHQQHLAELVDERTADLTNAKNRMEGELSKRRKAEQALRLEQKKLFGILEAMEESVFVVKEDHLIEYVNPPMEREFGPVNGRKCHEYFRDSPDVCSWCENRGAFSGKMVQREWFHAKTGKTYDLLDMPLLNVGGSISRLYMCHDITARKRAEEELRRSRERMRSLAAHLQSVREEERTWVAREIHDQLGQTLTSLSLDLTWLEGRLSKVGVLSNPALLETMDSMSKSVDGAIQLVREISTELRPGVLDDVGLMAAVEWQAARFQDRTGVECHVTLPPEGLRVDRDRSTALFRIFQEILTNVARHADATEVEINLANGSGEILLEVQDDGRGISDTDLSDPRAFGIMGMRERAAALGGDFHIGRAQAKGTKVVVRVPLSA